MEGRLGSTLCALSVGRWMLDCGGCTILMSFGSGEGNMAEDCVDTGAGQTGH